MLRNKAMRVDEMGSWEATPEDPMANMNRIELMN